MPLDNSKLLTTKRAWEIKKGTDLDNRFGTATVEIGTKKYWSRIINGRKYWSPLKYVRPDVSNRHVYEILAQGVYRVDGGPNQSFTSTIDIPYADDAVIYMNTNGVAIGRNGGLTFSGGNNVAVFGGEHIKTEVHLPPPYGPGIYASTARRCVQFVNQSGDVYVEGTQVHGNRVADAYWLNGTRSPTSFIFQNTLVGDFTPTGNGPAADSIAATYGGTDAQGNYWPPSSESHNDVWQLNGQANKYKNTKFGAYQCLNRSSYQGWIANDRVHTFEQERIYWEFNTTTNWDGSRAMGYPTGWFTSDNLNHMWVDIGPHVYVFPHPGWVQGAWWYPESMRPKNNFITIPSNTDVNVAESIGAFWKCAAYGLNYDLDEWNLIPTDIPNENDVRVVNHGINPAAPRPATLGTVIWRGSVRPINGISNHDIWEDADNVV